MRQINILYVQHFASSSSSSSRETQTEKPISPNWGNRISLNYRTNMRNSRCLHSTINNHLRATNSPSSINNSFIFLLIVLTHHSLSNPSLPLLLFSLPSIVPYIVAVLFLSVKLELRPSLPIQSSPPYNILSSLCIIEKYGQFLSSLQFPIPHRPPPPPTIRSAYPTFHWRMCPATCPRSGERRTNDPNTSNWSTAVPVALTTAARTAPRHPNVLTCNDRPDTRTPSPAACRFRCDTWVLGYLQLTGN